MRVFGVAGHGNGEVDHVGGRAKLTIKREIAAERLKLDTVTDLVHCLTLKFKDCESPLYYCKEIYIHKLELRGKISRCMIFETVSGSSEF